MFETTQKVDWRDKSLRKIRMIRVRPVGENYDVMGVIGELAGGQLVQVQVPFDTLGKKTWVSELLNYARSANVYLKDLCGSIRELKSVDFSAA